MRCIADCPDATLGHSDSSSVAGASASVDSASSLADHTAAVVVADCKEVVAASCWVVAEVLAVVGMVVVCNAAVAVERPSASAVVGHKQGTLVVQHQPQEHAGLGIAAADAAVERSQLRLDWRRLQHQGRSFGSLEQRRPRTRSWSTEPCWQREQPVIQPPEQR